MINLRAIRVGIELDDQIKWYDSASGFSVSTQGTKTTSTSNNSAKVTILGANMATVSHLTTEAKGQRMFVQLGHQNSGLSQIYVGDISRVEIGDPPDLPLTLESRTSYNAEGIVVSRSSSDRSTLSDISAAVAKDMGLALDFQAKDKQLSNYSHTGSAAHQVRLLATAGGVIAYVDDDSLVVTDFDKPRDGRVRILNAHTGMVGLPKLSDDGLKVRYVIDGESRVGGILRVETALEMFNGDYRINKLDWDAASHSDEFFYTATATRL